jgi:predicted nucleotidyltransferase
VEQSAILDVLTDKGCRFVVVGSTARALCGEFVAPNDLDIVVDDSPKERLRLLDALIALHACVRKRTRLERLRATAPLPWGWGFTAFTPWGQVDLVVRFADGSNYVDHLRDATPVELENGGTVWCHQTRRAA